MADEKKRFKTWNGMDRPANFMGVPVFPFIGLSVGGLITSVLGMAIFAWWVGLLLAVPFLLVGCAFCFVSALDDRYTRRVVFATRRILLSMRFGKGLIVAPQNPQWSQFYGKRFALCRDVSRTDDLSDRVSRRA
ncbi:hypothetical protein D3C76_1103120 [compost metagenome]